MFTKKQDEGRLGEDIAVDFLKRKGFKILARNFRIRAGEIDIIGIDGDTLAFIEVKTRKSGEYGTPLESITPWKLRSVIKTAEYYKHTHSKLPDAMRIDAVSIILNEQNEVTDLELVKNVS